MPPARQDCSHKTTCQGNFIGGLRLERVFYVSVLQSSCPHASQRLVYECLVYILSTEHVKKYIFFSQQQYWYTVMYTVSDVLHLQSGSVCGSTLSLPILT